MVIGPDATRNAKPEQYAEIDELLTAAFGRPDEAELVRRLRSEGDIWWEVIKPWLGVIGGYAALLKMRSPTDWVCLAPIAVLPRYQNAAALDMKDNRGHYRFGSRLVGEISLLFNDGILLRLKSDVDYPTTAVVVTDNRPFFERGGFRNSRARKLTSPFAAETLLIARPGTDVPEETLVFPPTLQEAPFFRKLTDLD